MRHVATKVTPHDHMPKVVEKVQLERQYIQTQESTRRSSAHRERRTKLDCISCQTPS